jgi:hypothetical protein
MKTKSEFKFKGAVKTNASKSELLEINAEILKALEAKDKEIAELVEVLGYANNSIANSFALNRPTASLGKAQELIQLYIAKHNKGAGCD